MIGVFEILVAVVAACMPGDEFLVAVNTDAIRIGLECQGGASILGGHRIAVGVEGHPKLLGGAHGGDRRKVIQDWGKRFEMSLFFFKAVHRSLVGLAMDTHVGNSLKPHSGSRVN